MKMNKTKKRRYHYVPGSLSSNFSLDRDALFSYDVIDGKIFQTTPRDVFVMRDFHAVPVGDQGVDYNIVEDMLSEFEHKGMESINSYVGGAAIDFDQRYWIAAFWALQYLRTPLVRNNTGAFLKETVRSVARILDKNDQFPPPPEGLAEYGENMTDLLNKGVIKIEILPYMHHANLHRDPSSVKVALRYELDYY